MIVEPTSLAPGRAETSGTELLSPAPGAGDDTFGRTLSNALRADRADRPPERRRAETGSGDDRGPGPASRRTDQPETGDDRVDEPARDDDPVSTDRNPNDRKPTDATSADARSAADGDRSTGTDQRGDQGADAEAHDGRGEGQRKAPAVDVVARDTPTPEALGIETADESPITEPLAAAATTAAVGSHESGPTVATEAFDTAPTPADDAGGALTARSDDSVEGAPGPGPAGTVTGDGDVTGIDLAAALETEPGSAPSAGRPSSGVGPEIDAVESSDEVADGGGAATVVAGPGNMTTAATASEPTATEPTVVTPTAATADRRPPLATDGETAGSGASPDSSIPVSDDTGVAPLGHRTTAGDPGSEADSPTGNPAPSSDATVLVDPTEPPPVTAGDETVDRSTGLRNDRPGLGLSPVASFRAPPSTPSQTPATATADPNAAPNLLELQTAGLAERLRPAFAAVRRGVNGLEELRLRIQNDNAGPINVDIATVDNRVRVLLSAGSDDLLRQLGQDRDRLADELRRAGFEQAFIDIESDDRNQRNNRHDRGASNRPGFGALGSGTPGADATGPTEHAASRRQRGLTGLDLDL